MKIGIGLPNPVPRIKGRLLVEWAKRAEEAGFSGLVTIDRIAYPSYDSLTTLTAAAAATERISLMTNILLAPVYSPVLLAKTAASIDQISDGRLTLGLAPGGRPDDYEITGRDFHRRGRLFDDGLEVMHKVWRGEALAEGSSPVGPTPRTSEYPSSSAAIRTRPSNASSDGGRAGLLAARLWSTLLPTPSGCEMRGPLPAAVVNRELRHSPTFLWARTLRRRLATTCSTTTASSATMRK